MKGKYVRLEATERSYSWTSVAGGETEKGVCIRREGELEGEMQESREYGYRERKTDEKRGQVIILSTSFPPVD